MFKAARGARHPRPFAPWRIVVWMVMLLAAGGFVVNAYGAIVVASAMRAMTPEQAAGAIPDPRIVLGWAVAYVVAAFMTMAVSLATLRWREWARAVMRVLALLLMVWSAYTAWFAYAQWQAAGTVLGQPGLSAQQVTLIARQHTILLVGLVLKIVSVPVLAWLAWSLGSVKVRQQFAQPVL